MLQAIVTEASVYGFQLLNRQNSFNLYLTAAKKFLNVFIDVFIT